MQEYLKRVLLHNAPLAAPQDVAGILASYAHDARLRIEQADLPALASGLRPLVRDSAEPVFYCRPLTGNKKMSFLCDLCALCER